MNKYQVLELHRCKLGEDSLQGKREEQSRYYHQSYVHLGATGASAIYQGRLLGGGKREG